MAGASERSAWIKAPWTKYLPNFQIIRPNTKPDENNTSNRKDRVGAVILFAHSLVFTGGLPLPKRPGLHQFHLRLSHATTDGRNRTEIHSIYNKQSICAPLWN